MKLGAKFTESTMLRTFEKGFKPLYAGEPYRASNEASHRPSPPVPARVFPPGALAFLDAVFTAAGQEDGARRGGEAAGQREAVQTALGPTQDVRSATRLQPCPLPPLLANCPRLSARCAPVHTPRVLPASPAGALARFTLPSQPPRLRAPARPYSAAARATTQALSGASTSTSAPGTPRAS